MKLREPKSHSLSRPKQHTIPTCLNFKALALSSTPEGGAKFVYRHFLPRISVLLCLRQWHNSDLLWGDACWCRQWLQGDQCGSREACWVLKLKVLGTFGLGKFSLHGSAQQASIFLPQGTTVSPVTGVGNEYTVDFQLPIRILYCDPLFQKVTQKYAYWGKGGGKSRELLPFQQWVEMP